MCSIHLDVQSKCVLVASHKFNFTLTVLMFCNFTVEPRIDVGELIPHVVLGRAIIIPCRITSGNPPPTREWSRRKEVFRPNQRVSVRKPRKHCCVPYLEFCADAD